MFLAIPLLSQREGLYVAFRLNHRDQAHGMIPIYGITQFGPKTGKTGLAPVVWIKSNPIRQGCFVLCLVLIGFVMSFCMEKNLKMKM